MPKGKQPPQYEGTNTQILNIIEREETRSKTIQLLKKCKQQDKGKRMFKVPGSPVKTWFICKSKERAVKRINEFKKSLIVRT